MEKKKRWKKLLPLFLITAVFLLTGNSAAAEEGTSSKIQIRRQPQDCYCAQGKTARFSVETAGENLVYQWEYSRDGESWQKIYFDGYNTAEVSFEAVPYRFSYQYRVRITDKSGEEIVSEPATLREYKITKQPQTQYCFVGDTVEFKVGVSGESLEYSWEFRRRAGEEWEIIYFPGHLTDTLSATLTQQRDGYEFRCVVTDSGGNQLTSEVARLCKTDLTIIRQPREAVSELDEEVSYTVEADGEGLRYQWEYSKNGQDWQKIFFDGYNTDCLSVQMIQMRTRYQFRCVVTDKYGNRMISDPAGWSLKVPVPAEKLVFDNYYTEGDESETGDGLVLADAEFFYNHAEQEGTMDEETASVTYTLDTAVAATDTVALHFTAAAEESAVKLALLINGNLYARYALSTQDTQIVVPISGYSEINTIAFQLNAPMQKIHLGDLQLLNYFDKVSFGELHAGYFVREEINDVAFSEEEGIQAGKTMACLRKEDSLFTLGDGRLQVWDTSDPVKPKQISEVTGLGDVRDMTFCKEDVILVSARGNGAYFVDISDRKNPQILSHYDTLEQVSGVYVYGEFAFLCSRYFGVEVVDISDVEHPAAVTVIANSAASEYIDCCVSEGILYVGAWGQRRVDIYDVTDLSNVQKLASVDTDGNAHGCCVKDGILYVATGFHSREASGSASAPGYGMGNGLELYDVSEPSAPQWLSTRKIEGRYYYTGNDIWKVYVSGNYAYFTSTYNGMYIYDVTDKTDPVLTDHITVRIPKESENYKKVNVGTYVFPYDTSAYMTTPVLGAAVSSGAVYLAGSQSDVYVYETEKALPETREKPVELTCRAEDGSANITEVPGYTVQEYKNQTGAVYAAVPYGDFYVLACGSGGVQVLDKELQLVDTYETQGAVKDIKTYGEYLYTAESGCGLGVYRLHGSQLEKIGSCNTTVTKKNLTSIEITSDGRYIVGQGGWTSVVTFDVSDPTAPYQAGAYETGSMYYRNVVSNRLENGTVGVMGNTKTYWFQVAADGVLVNLKTSKNPFWVETNGSAAAGKNVLVITGNGYVYYNPMETGEEELSGLPVHKVKGVNLRGKPIVYQDLLVVCTEYDGTVTFVDISDLDNPVLLRQFKAGLNCDLPYIDGEQILLPLRTGGLLRLVPESGE